MCSVSVMMPAWLPVKLSLGTPTSCSAMHSSAMALRSPAVISMSISRPGLGVGHLAGQVQQLVGLLAHGGDRHHHLVAVADGPGHVVGHGADAVGVRDGGAAELHHHQGHGLQATSGVSAWLGAAFLGARGQTASLVRRAVREATTPARRTGGP